MTGQGAGALHLREIRSVTDTALRRAHRLLTRIFPRAEMLPLSAWKDVLEERDTGVWTDLNWHLIVANHVTHAHSRLVGAATGTYLGNVNVGLIGYIAVGSAARTLGIGPRLRWALRLAFERDARRLRGRPLKALVGEVRPDNPWLGRLVRNGAIALDLPYYQPSLRHRDEPVPLVLYYQPLHLRRTSLPVAEVRRLIYTIWRRSYRIPKPLSHPIFRRMLRALTGRSRIGQRRLDPRPG